MRHLHGHSKFKRILTHCITLTSVVWTRLLVSRVLDLKRTFGHSSDVLCSLKGIHLWQKNKRKFKALQLPVFETTSLQHLSFYLSIWYIESKNDCNPKISLPKVIGIQKFQVLSHPIEYPICQIQSLPKR